VLVTAAAVAVTIAIPARRIIFVPIALVFIYTTVLNMFERPEGLQIAAWFIVTIIVASLISRVMRSTERRAASAHSRRLTARAHRRNAPALFYLNSSGANCAR